MPTYPVVGIVVTRDGATNGCLARCLESLRDAGVTPLVLDDASIDNTADVSRRYGAVVKTLSPAGPGRPPWNGRDEPDVRYDTLLWAGSFAPTWAVSLDDDEWLASPRTVGQAIREQIKDPRVGCYYYRTLHFWNSMTRVKGWRHDPLDMRPRAWRWNAAEPPYFLPRALHPGQVPRYAYEQVPSFQPNICVGHMGYFSREVREKKAALYLKLSGPDEFRWPGKELSTDEGVMDWNPAELKGLP